MVYCIFVYYDLFHYAPNSLKSDGGDHQIPLILNGGDREIPLILNGGIAKSQAVFLGGIAKYTGLISPKFLVPPLPYLMRSPLDVIYTQKKSKCFIKNTQKMLFCDRL